jgi:hypothetical protein
MGPVPSDRVDYCGSFLVLLVHRHPPTSVVKLILKNHFFTEQKYIFFLFLCLGYSKLFRMKRHHFFLCEIDEFIVRMGLGRSKHYTFRAIFKKNQTIIYFFSQFLYKRVLKHMSTPRSANATVPML